MAENWGHEENQDFNQLKLSFISFPYRKFRNSAGPRFQRIKFQILPKSDKIFINLVL